MKALNPKLEDDQLQKHNTPGMLPEKVTNIPARDPKQCGGVGA